MEFIYPNPTDCANLNSYSALNPPASPSEAICRVPCTPRPFADWLNDSPTEDDSLMLQYPRLSPTPAEDEAQTEDANMSLLYPPSSTCDDQISFFQYPPALLVSGDVLDSSHDPPAIIRTPQIHQHPSFNSNSALFTPQTQIALAPPAPSTPTSCKATDPTTPRSPASLASHFSISPLTFKHVQDFHHTPFGKHYGLSTDWMISESHISPVLRTSAAPLHSSFDPQDLHSLAMATDDSRTRSPGGVMGITFMEKLRTARPPASPPSRSSALTKPVIRVPQGHPTDLLSLPFHSPSKAFNLSNTSDTSLPIAPSPALAPIKETINALQHFNTPTPLQEIFSLSPLTPLTPLTLLPTATLPMAPVRKVFVHLAQGKNSKKRGLSTPASPTPLPRPKRVRCNRGSTNVDLSQAADHILSPQIDTLPELRIPRATSPSTSTPNSVPLPSFTNRTFPLDTVKISPTFHLFYRRFPASSYFQPTCSEYISSSSPKHVYL
jgi:hypothetical protein